jgi:hypothetical protein
VPVLDHVQQVQSLRPVQGLEPEVVEDEHMLARDLVQQREDAAVGELFCIDTYRLTVLRASPSSRAMRLTGTPKE